MPEIKNKTRFFTLLFWLFFILLGAGSFSTFYLLSSYGDLPSFEELENPKSLLASEVYSSDEVVLGKYFKENRTIVNYEEISPNVINALIATEDERFREHSGIDARGTLRAVAYFGGKGGASTITQQLAKMLFHDREQNVFKRIIQKLKEWIISVRLERQYTKNEIITMYLNKFDFINNAVGIKSASQVYFNKPPDSLKTEEAAMLVGMCKNPALYNPLRRPELTQQRRNIVLHQMYRNGAISEQEYDSLKQTSLNLDYKVVDHKEGPAPYFREVLRLELIELLNKKDPETGKYLISKPGNIPYNIYSDGLKIYTTIDSRMQAYAEWAVTEHMRGELQKDFDRDLKKKRNAPFDWRVSKKEINQILETAMKRTRRYRILAGQECANCGRRGKVIHPIKGEDGKDYYLCTADDCGHQESAAPKDSIPAVFDKPVPMKVFSWQGEIDTIMSPMDSIKYYKGFLQTGMMSMDPHTGYVKAWVGGINYKHFSYDHVKQSRRQVGSTFKPMVYALAVQEGIEPCMELPNTPTCFDLPEGGTWCPKNSDAEYGGMISVKYGLANSINTVTAWIMKQFGPKSVVEMARKMGITSPLDPVPSLCLGVADLSVFELTGANATFANKGVWIEPTYITRIEDKNGTIIKEFRPKTSEAMSEETAYVMLEIMKGVVDGVYNRHTKKRIGTGLRLRASSRNYGGIRTPVAGKTGTTQNNSDGWFIGVTPDLVTGVWVGAEDRSVRFSQTNYGQGANTGLPIFGYFMQKAYSDKRLNISQGDFEKPETKLKVELDCEKYYKQKGTGATFFDPETEDFSK